MPGAGEEAPPRDRVLLVRVGSAVYACDVRHVREIVRAGRATRLPGAPAHVRGLTNLRGEVLAVVDVGLRLDPASQPSDGPRIVVVESADRRAGLLVDEVLEVREVDIPEEPAPSAKRQNARRVRKSAGRVTPKAPPAVSDSSTGDVSDEGASGLTRPLGQIDGQIVLLLDVSALVSQALQ